MRRSTLELPALAATALLAILAYGCGAPPPSPTAPSTAPAQAPAAPGQRCDAPAPVVVLMRHAEKASEEADAELSEVGQVRARRVAELLASSGATRLFATDVKRTQQTLAPLAERLKRPVEVRPAKATADLARELAALPPGTVAVVAHHSNGVPPLARALGAPIPDVDASDALAHDAFGRVFVVVLGCGTRKAALVELSSSATSATAPPGPPPAPM